MAPNRRKCAVKANWKSGDLVLAKVKGYPAWPAVVNEPEEWGYSADPKKVLVYFFGTKEIAFCNPVDVEDFTEEKKLFLLGKRHGKGSAFQRALNEIIHCFEKLKNQDEHPSTSVTEETNITRENNSYGSLTKSMEDEAPIITVNQLSSEATNDLNFLTDAAVAAAAEDVLHDKEKQLEEAHSSLRLTNTRRSTTFSSRSETYVTRSRNRGSQERISLKRFSSCPRRGVRKFQNVVLPSINNSRSSIYLGGNVVHNRHRRRIRKSSDGSEDNVVYSPACMSNDSLEDNDSEVMTAVSRAPNSDDSSTVDSGYKPVEMEPFGENNKGEQELGDRCDFQTHAIIIKKTRKLNQKRLRKDTAAVAKLDIVVSEAEMLKSECASASNVENFSERYVKEDCDEHLPLVKRARVRMGRPPSDGDEEVKLLHKEERTLVYQESCPVQSPQPSNCEVDAPADKESASVEGDPDAHVTTARKPLFWEAKKNFVDREVSLPPSKRLLRALEAMSANVAENNRNASSSPTADFHSNHCCSSPFVEFSELSMRNKPDIEFGTVLMEDGGNSDSQPTASKSHLELPSNCGNTCVVVAPDSGKSSSIVDCSNPDFLEESFQHKEAVDGKHLNRWSSKGLLAETDARHKLVKPHSPDFVEELAHLDHKIEHPYMDGASVVCREDISSKSSDLILVEGFDRGSLGIDPGIPIDSVDVEGDEKHKKKPLLLSDNQGSQRSDFVEDARPASTDPSLVLSATPVKVLSSSNHQHLLRSNYFFNDHLKDRIVSVNQSSSALNDGPDSIARASILKASASGNSDHFGSPNFKLQLQKVEPASNPRSKGNSLSSFEAIFRSLTRTKDSIGRATRIAIECARSGFAAKVVEILACKLESETSLHRKVDLFFLVDSIAQCSRGMKGDGGIYPSAIQAILPRLLLAAAPPACSYENHRQCLKVLRVWLEREILPEPVIHHHIQELNNLCGSYPISGSHRSFRNERAFDDPIREMEGMLDEYGSNSSIQLPGFSMAAMLRDDGRESDSDGEGFEAVTPEHDGEYLDGETTPSTPFEKRSHLLEDVDVERETKDGVLGCEVEIASSSNIAGANGPQVLHHQSDNHFGPSFGPHPPKYAPSIPVSSPRLPPAPPSVFPHAVCDPVSNGPDSEPYPCSQNYCRVKGFRAMQAVLPGVKARSLETGHLCAHENKDFEDRVPRQRPRCNNVRSSSNQPTSPLSGRSPNDIQPMDGAFSKRFYLRPPHLAPSNQFSYVPEQRSQPRRDIPPPPRPNRFHPRNARNGNFYRDRRRHKFVPRYNIGQYCRPPPFISGPYYCDSPRMAHAPMSCSGPPREPGLLNNRWNFPSRSMNHRQYNPYRPPHEGP